MIKELNNQELDSFVSQQNYSQFLQSSLWSDFQKELGNRVWQVGIEEDSLKASVLVIEKKLPFNLTYFYMPRGPIISNQTKDKDRVLKFLLKGVRDISIQTKKRQEIFFRFETLDKFDLENVSLVKSVQPAHTLLLDLNKTEEELLVEMHQKTRYNIRLAKKKGIEIKKIENQETAIDIFSKLIQETSVRDKFMPHSKEYYQKMLKSLGKNACLWVAKYESQILAANIIVNFGDTVTYLHGASSNQHRNLMAPHLLQWEQIKWAKDNGFKIYDFWGISESDPRWAGFTRFKKGFGGQEKNLAGTFDLVYNQRAYKIYNFIKKFR
jgi:lipid II:glycine glycyltransferase (peptidoglycan interpeptide bridge formation enzyme)